MWELGISSRQPGTKVKVEDDLSSLKQIGVSQKEGPLGT